MQEKDYWDYLEKIALSVDGLSWDKTNGFNVNKDLRYFTSTLLNPDEAKKILEHIEAIHDLKYRYAFKIVSSKHTPDKKRIIFSLTRVEECHHLSVIAEFLNIIRTPESEKKWEASEKYLTYKAKISHYKGDQDYETSIALRDALTTFNEKDQQLGFTKEIQQKFKSQLEENTSLGFFFQKNCSVLNDLYTLAQHYYRFEKKMALARGGARGLLFPALPMPISEFIGSFLFGEGAALCSVNKKTAAEGKKEISEVDKKYKI